MWNPLNPSSPRSPPGRRSAQKPRRPRDPPPIDAFGRSDALADGRIPDGAAGPRECRRDYGACRRCRQGQGLRAADAIDIVGTGGDSSGSYNVSTLASIITAACGVTVAKHGNRAASSRSGAADILTVLHRHGKPGRHRRVNPAGRPCPRQCVSVSKRLLMAVAKISAPRATPAERNRKCIAEARRSHPHDDNLTAEGFRYRGRLAGASRRCIA